MEVRTDRMLFESYLAPALRTAYGIAWRLTSDEAQAEALLQKAVLRAYAAFTDARPNLDFRVRLVHLLCREFQNRPGKEAPAVDLRLWEIEADALLAQSATRLCCSEAGLGAEAADRTPLQSQALTDAFTRLPDAYRVVCALYFMGDWSYQEIADMADYSLDVVRQRLHRARRWLSAVMRMAPEESGLAPSSGNRPRITLSAVSAASLSRA